MKHNIVQECVLAYLFRLLILCSFLLCFRQSLLSQNEIGTLPYIFFPASTYKAESQNWAVVQDKRGIMYFGNNGCVLEYDGENWTRIPVSNNTVVRSLAISEKGVIYVGAMDEFGYLEIENNGELVYVSLIPFLKEKELEISDVWNICIQNDGSVVFQTYANLFIWDGIKIESISAKEKISQIFMVHDKLIVLLNGKGLFEYKDDQLQTFDDREVFQKGVNDICAINSKTILVSTFSKGIFILEKDNHNNFIYKGEFILENKKNYRNKGCPASKEWTHMYSN